MGAAASVPADGSSEATDAMKGGFMARMKNIMPGKKVDEIQKKDGGEEPEDFGDDEEALKKAYQKLGFQNERVKEQVKVLEAQNLELRMKLADMVTAIKQLKSELASVSSDKEAAEAHLAQMANPEREAYMHKYALEKLKEEFEKYKKDVGIKEADLKRDLRRLQENLANRSSADDAAKAAMLAEIRELKSKRGLLQFFDGAGGQVAAPNVQTGGNPRSPKGGKGGKTESPKGKGKYLVADFDPSSGLKPKTEQSARAAGVVVTTEDGDVLDTKAEARAKRNEAAARTGREYLIAQGVLPPDEEEEETEQHQHELPRIVEYVMDPESANDMFGPDSYLQRRAQEEWGEQDFIPGEGLVDVNARDTDCHRQFMHSFGTHLADAYSTPPFVVRQDIVDKLVDFVTSVDHALAVVVGDHGMGKSHLMAAVGVTVELEVPGAILCPLFVGSCAGSRDSRLLLKALVRMLTEADNPTRSHKDEAVPDAFDDLKATCQQLVNKMAKAGTPPIILLDAVSEVHDLYVPPILEWLPSLLANAVVVMTLVHRREVELIVHYASIQLSIELSVLTQEQRTSLLTHLVTKHNTAVNTELQRQKDSMREKAMAELQRLQDERMQRRLQREKLRGPSKKKGKKDKDGKKRGKKVGGLMGVDEEPEGASLDVEEEEKNEDEGLLGMYETMALLDKADSGQVVYLVMAIEFLLSVERQLPALEEVTVLPGSFDALIDHMLDLLENKHGKDLVRSAMMFVASARFALSQAELLQLLLSDDSLRADLDGLVDIDSELFAKVPTSRDWWRFMRDFQSFLRPRGVHDIRAQDLRMRHQAVRNAVLRRYCTHRCFWHRSTSDQEVHLTLADFYSKCLKLPMPNPSIHVNPTVFERWAHAELLWQYTHAAQDLIFHQILAGDWAAVESVLTSLRFVENKCRVVDPYHLLTDYSATLDAAHFVSPINDDGVENLSFLQRIRIIDFQRFVTTYAIIFKIHPELVIQQAANMPDDSSITREALRIVGDAEIETAWFKFLNKSQLGDPCLMNLKCNGPIACVGYSPDGRKIATGSSDGFGGKVTIWDSRSGSEMCHYIMPGAIVSLQFSGDGKLLLSVSNEGTVMLADMLSFKERAREILSDTRVSGASISIDGKKMILVASGGLLNLWDLPAETSSAGIVFNRYIKMFEMVDEDDEGRPSPMTCVAISPSVRRVATGMSGGLLKVFSLTMTEGLVVMHVLAGHSSVVTNVAFSSDSSRICSASLDHSVRIWDAERGGKENAMFTDSAEIRACCFSPDGGFVVTGLDNGRMLVLDISTLVTVVSFGTHAGRINSCQFEPNGKFLISGAMDGVCKVWMLQDTASAETFTGHPKTDVTACSYSIDGSELATSGGDGSLKLWGGARGKEIMSFPGHSDRTTCCVFSPLVGDRKSGVLSSSLYDGTVRLWENLTGMEDEQFRHNSTYLTCMAFSPEKPPDKRAGRVLAGSFDGSVIVWDVETRNLIVKLGVEIEGSGGWRVEKIRDRHEDAVTACAFMPVDGSERAVTSSVDCTVKVWNTKWGNCVATLKGHSASINCCCFSNTGEQIYTGSSDNTIREWLASAPFTCLSIIIGHYAPVQGVTFATSGKHLFSVSEDRTLRAWLKFPIDGDPGPNTAAARVGSQPFSVTSSNGRITDWFQWKQVALFASAHPLRCIAGSRSEDEEEVSCGASDGSVYLLRLMRPGDY